MPQARTKVFCFQSVQRAPAHGPSSVALARRMRAPCVMSQARPAYGPSTVALAHTVCGPHGTCLVCASRCRVFAVLYGRRSLVIGCVTTWDFLVAFHRKLCVKA